MDDFYRTVIEVEVLSRGPLPSGISLGGLAEEIIYGDCSGTVQTVSEDVVDGPTMARLLKAQGSDPAFLGLTEEGQEADE